MTDPPEQTAEQIQEQRADVWEARTEASAVAREARTAIRAETLAAVADGLDSLARAVETNLSEERLSGILASGQQASARQFIRLNAVLGITLIVAVIGLSGIWLQSKANNEQGARIQGTSQDAAVVAGYVRDCLQTPAARRDPARCGTDGTAAVVKGLVDFIECSLLIRPEARTRDQLDTCATDAFRGDTVKKITALLVTTWRRESALIIGVLLALVDASVIEGTGGRVLGAVLPLLGAGAVRQTVYTPVTVTTKVAEAAAAALQQAAPADVGRAGELTPAAQGIVDAVVDTVAPKGIGA